MTDLREQLHRLGDQVELDRPRATPGEVWRWGRRYRRRRTAGTVAIAALVVVALAVTGIVGLRRAQAPQPARPDGDTAPAFPDVVYPPSPWLPGTTGAAPMGPLAVVLQAERKSWTGTSQGLVGISATTGEYRFLDLPRMAPNYLTSAVLSPDGARLAYWTGTRAGDDAFIDGFAVYDSTDGTVSSVPVTTAHGLQVDSGLGGELRWSDDTTLVASFSRRAAQPGLSRPAPPVLWRAGQPRIVLPRSLTAVGPLGSGPSGIVTYERHRHGASSCHGLDPLSGRHRRLPAAACEGLHARVSPGGAYQVHGNTYVGSTEVVSQRSLFRVLTTSTPPAPVAPSGVLAYQQLDGAIGWLDSDHLAVQRSGSRVGDEDRITVDDISTGASRQVTRFEDTRDPRVSYATDLLAQPSRPGLKPPSPADPRTLVGTGAGSVLIGLGLLVWWRRRVRP